MSTAAPRERDQAGETGPPPELSGHLAYLLKHAQLGLAELTAAALEPYGVSGRELAVLTVLAAGEPASQHEAAQRLGVDRTTMVALVDALEGKRLVCRQPHAEDRRRNVVALTEAGTEALQRGGAAARDAERRFLAPLRAQDARQLRDGLLTLVEAQHRAGKP